MMKFIAIRKACEFISSSRKLANKKTGIQGFDEAGDPFAECRLKTRARSSWLILTNPWYECYNNNCLR